MFTHKKVRVKLSPAEFVMEAENVRLAPGAGAVAALISRTAPSWIEKGPVLAVQLVVKVMRGGREVNEHPLEK